MMTRLGLYRAATKKLKPGPNNKFTSWSDAFDFCRECDKPLIVVVNGEEAKIFPSGRMERRPHPVCPQGGYQRLVSGRDTQAKATRRAAAKRAHGRHLAAGDDTPAGDS